MAIKTRILDIELNGKTIKKDFEIPDFWSDRAALIVADKYAADHENSALEVIDRVVYTILGWGIQQDYFEDPGKNSESNDFARNLKDMLINQRASFNSPVWFNIGIEENSNQASGCFIFPVEDNMEDILQHTVREGIVFQSGSGSGVNVSKLRAKGEKLSNKGEASGPISFMRIWDACAGSVRSGGKTRRAAKLVCMNDDHPDILEFIECKKKEEDKAKALMAAGISAEEAYSTVSFQNANHSIRVSDEFMEAATNDKQCWLHNRGNGDPHAADAKEILEKAAEIAWETGDPGIQFDDRMNVDNPIPLSGRINSTNPCFSGDMKLLTCYGYKTFAELEGTKPNIISPKDGSVLQTQKVWCSGIKPTYEIKFHWKAGIDSLKCTKDHMWQLINGEFCFAKDLKGKRIKPFFKPKIVQHTEALFAGYIQGDGNTRRLLSKNHKGIEVYIGHKDNDIAQMFNIPREEIAKDGKGTWYSKEAAKLATDFELLPEKLCNRSLPINKIMNLSKEQVGDFLSGLFSANGSVISNTRIALKTTCKKLIEQVQHLLEHFWGIESYITTNKPNLIEWDNGDYISAESYDLNIHRWKHLIKFIEHIGFIHQYKTEDLIQTILERSPTVTSVNYISDQKVYDFTELRNHLGIVSGFVAHNCSEFSAVDNSSCNLASLNLLKYYNNSHNDNFDWTTFGNDIHVLITAMDILVDNADYPTPEVTAMTKATRPLGLGFTNLGALLMVMGSPYDSNEGRRIAKEITKGMTRLAYVKSIQLSEIKGPFAKFEENKEQCMKVAVSLMGIDKDPENPIYSEMKKHGLRNSQVTLLAPTGTISFMMDADTTGIEPLFALKATKQLSGGGQIEIIPKCVEKAHSKLIDQGLFPNNPDPRNYQREIEKKIENLSLEQQKIFATANEISWKAHLDMMAACQPHLNGAISKTINMPADCTVQDVFDAYVYAWEVGLKSIAIYRDGSKQLQPLTDTSKIEPIQEEEQEDAKWMAVRKKLDSTCSSLRHKFNISGFEGYLHAGLYEDGEPGEIFIQASKNGCYSKETEVLTHQGWKLFKDCSEKDLFATRNINTHKFEWEKATDFQEFDYIGEMYHFYSDSVDLLVTSEHRMLIQENSITDTEVITSAQNLHEMILSKDPEWKFYRYSPRIPLSSCWEGLEIIEKVFNQTNKTNSKQIKMSGDDFCAFMGMYLAEGSSHYYEPKGNYLTTITQRKTSKGYDSYSKLLNKIMDGVVHYDEKGMRFSSVNIYKYLKQFGTARNKFIPERIMNATPRQIEIFLDYFWLGDGTTERFRLFTSSTKMASQLTELAQKIGMTTNVKIREPEDKTICHKEWTQLIKAENTVPNHVISLNTTHKASPVQSKKIQYDDKVYCVSVPNTILYVRRNGKASWCGNSMTQGLLDSCATLFSLSLQYGVPLEKLVEKFKTQQFQPSGFTDNEDIRMCTSIVDYIARWLEQEFLEEETDKEEVILPPPAKTEPISYSLEGPPCTHCGGGTNRMGTCYVCTCCGETTGCS